MHSTHKTIGFGIIALAIATSPLARPAPAAVWVGGTTSKLTAWNTSTNWLPADTPNSVSEYAEFSAPFEHSPQFETHLGQLGGILMTGDTVSSVVITKHPDATANSGDPHFQTSGTTLKGYEATGVLIDNTNDATLTFTATRWKIADSQSWINNSNNLFTVNARVELDKDKSLTIGGTGNTLITGPLSSANSVGSVTKIGSGTLTLSGVTAGSGSPMYSGPIVVSEGTLLVTGAIESHDSATVTANGGTLGGTGVIARNTTINADATLAPGAPGSTDRRLEIDRNLTIAGTTAFDLFSAGDYESILVNGSGATNRTFKLGGVIEVTAQPDMVFAPGNEFRLFEWGANTSVVVNGPLTVNLPVLSGGLSWQLFGDSPLEIDTVGRVARIVVVPEPTALGTLALAGLALLPSRRRAN